MKLRTSYFNITALRKDILRFAPVWAIYLIAGLLIGINGLSGYLMDTGNGAVDLAESIGPLGIMNMLYAIVCAELLFGDLFNSRLCNALHAFPLRREGWFITHTAAGLLFSFVPNLIMSLCFMPFMGGMWYVSLIWLLGMTLEYLFFFGLAVFSAMCTGNRFAMAAVYFLINFLSAIVLWFVNTFYAPLLYGVVIPEDIFGWFCPVAGLSVMIDDLVVFKSVPIPDSVFERTRYTFQALTADWGYPALLAVLGLALLGGAVLLYRKRKLESAGDFVAFRCLKPVVTVVFTLSIGALFELFGDAFLNMEYACLAIGIIVGYFVIRMLLQRTVKVFCKRAFWECAAIGVGLVLTIVITWLDPFGIVSWVPEENQVESVTLSGYYYFDSEYDNAYVTLRDSADIETVTRAHERILEEYAQPKDGMWCGTYQIDVDNVYLIYKMKDGREIARRYEYPANGESAKLLEPFFSRPEYVLEYEDWELFLSQIEHVEIDCSWTGDYKEIYSSLKMKELLEAVKTDCEDGKMAQNRVKNSDYMLGITTQENWIKISVYEDCENTVKWIEDYLAP